MGRVPLTPPVRRVPFTESAPVNDSVRNNLGPQDVGWRGRRAPNSREPLTRPGLRTVVLVRW